MPEDTKAFFTKFKKDAAKISGLLPEATSSFMQMFGKIMVDGAISLKQKELIALGIAISIQCGPCIKLHVQKSLAAGANKEEILEVAAVSLMMGGGPAFTHIPEVIDALEALQG